MVRARQQRLEELFAAAAELPGPELAAFLASLGSGDEELRPQLETLLEADRRNGDGFLLSAPPLPPEEPGEEPEEARPGARMGPYRLVSVLGEGEHAVVYLAERDSPDGRRVALKVLRRSARHSLVLRRFEEERRIIALMGHPNIARLYEAGIAPDGRTYLAMEYVPGEPITTMAAAAGLSVRERLGLFVQACLGVEHAHQRGIIHRDLKPRNIIAGPDGKGGAGGTIVKVIDFGIAKATGSDHLHGQTLTRAGQVMGTPAYMSPEQVRGDMARVDTRSDIYSLGTVLYELLTGVPAVDTSTAGPLTIIASILDQEPRRAESINPALRGDVATIINACIAKDPSRRYQSVAALREDVEGFLEGRPIMARPPSAAYVTGKFLRRHRVPVAAAVVVMAVGAAAAANTWRVQRRQFDLAIQMAQSWFDRTRDIARTVGDRARRGPDLMLLSAHAEALLSRDPDHPGLLKLDADVLGAIGDFEQDQDRLGEAVRRWERALEIRRELAARFPKSPDHQMDLSIALVRIGDFAYERGDLAEAVRWYERAMEIDERTYAAHPDLPRAVTLMGWSCHRLGTLAGLRGDMETAHAYLRRELGVFDQLQDLERSADSRRALAMSNLRLYHYLQQSGDVAAAAPYLVRAGEKAREAAALEPEDRLAVVTLGIVRCEELDRPGVEWDRGSALAHARETLRLAESVVAQDPGDETTTSLLYWARRQVEKWGGEETP